MQEPRSEKAAMLCEIAALSVHKHKTECSNFSIRCSFTMEAQFSCIDWLRSNIPTAGARATE